MEFMKNLKDSGKEYVYSRMLTRERRVRKTGSIARATAHSIPLLHQLVYLDAGDRPRPAQSLKHL